MCVLVCPSCVVSGTSWSGVWCGGVWPGLGSCRAPPLLAGVLGRVCVCVCVRALLVLRFSWVGCAVWGVLVRVLGHAWLCARSSCSSLFPVLVCGVGGVLGPGFGCAGCVCACVPVLRGLRHLLIGGVVRGCVAGPGLLPRPATPG